MASSVTFNGSSECTWAMEMILNLGALKSNRCLSSFSPLVKWYWQTFEASLSCMPRMSAGSHTNGKALRTFDVENVNADAAALTTEKFL